jgi:hypothetical protein
MMGSNRVGGYSLTLLFAYPRFLKSSSLKCITPYALRRRRFSFGWFAVDGVLREHSSPSGHEHRSRETELRSGAADCSGGNRSSARTSSYSNCRLLRGFRFRGAWSWSAHLLFFDLCFSMRFVRGLHIGHRCRRRLIGDLSRTLRSKIRTNN